MKRALVLLAGSLLILAALAGLAFVGLALSERGTRFLADQAERLLPVRLTGVAGTLWRSVRVDRVVLTLARSAITIDDLAIELRLFPVLFDNRLELVAVRAASVEYVQLGDADPDEPPARLALPFMPVDIEIGQLDLASLRLAGIPEVALRGAASWTSSGLAVRDLAVDGEALQLRLTGTLGSSQLPSLEAALEWSLPLAGWRGEGRVAGVVDQLVISQVVTGPYELAVDGSANLAVPAQPGFDLAVVIADIDTERYALAGISGRVAGTLDALVVEAAAQIDARYGEPFALQATARGPARGPLEFDARAVPLGGELLAVGVVDWASGLAVTLRGSARDLALEPLLEEFEGQLGANFAVDYRAQQVEVTITDLAGLIDGRRVSGQGQVRGGDGEWVAEAVEVALGDNHAKLRGRWQDRTITVDGQVAAPALEQFGLGMTGALQATVDIAGEWPKLEGSVAVSGPAFAAAGVEIAGLELTATLSGGALTGRAAASRLGRGQLDLDALNLTVSGALDAFDWRLAAEQGEARGRFRQSADEVRLDVDALDADVYERRFAIDTPVSARWRAGAVSVDPFCIAGGEARACIGRFRLEGGRIVTAGVLERLPVAMLQDLLPIAVDEAGFIEGRWDVAGAGADWSGTAELAGRSLVLVLPDTADQRIELPDVELQGVFAGAALDLAVLARSAAFQVEGNARLARIAPDGALSGAILLTLDDLAWMKRFDSRIADLAGAVSGRLTLSGTASQPVPEAALELRDGRLALEDPGFRLDGIEVAAQVDQSGAFEFSGTGRQEQGSVALEGQGSGLFDGELRFESAVRGQGLRVTHPEWEVEVAPDLALAWDKGRARLTGSVELPRAEVRLKTLPSSVPRPSEDVIVVGREVSANGAPNRLRMNIRVGLGRAVKLRALGIEAGLQGDLNVRRDARGQASVRGTLDVTGGLISAQGQTLAIESGVVVYNGPIGNPYIDLRAVREIEDQRPPVKVGLHIRGNADRLTSSVFSEPAMAENRALAFLVLGRDIDEESKAESGQLLTAAINLGLSQSKSLTGQLQRISGLDELSAVAEAEDSFAIAAGKRIGKDLYLRYTYNTLSAVGAILISFDLTERWRLEALSGEDSAMDILYRIDR